MKYRKSQIGWIVILVFGLTIIFINVAQVNQGENNPFPFLVFRVFAFLFVVIGLLFYKLTVELIGSTLKLTYGIGLIRIKFHMDEMQRSEVIKTPWYWGLGIRMTPKGMLYNIQGSKAVKIEYISKGERKSVMVGTPEPEQLKKALDHNFK
ncbi:MAG: hypothetical protein ABJN84_06390 [Flavobacteriaceae bacterium]